MVSSQETGSINAAFVVPVNNPVMLRNLEKNLEQKFSNYQVISVEGASSFFDAWRKGVKQSKHDYLVLTHQDVAFKSLPNLDELFKDEVGMVGVAGSKVITRQHPWWFEDGINRFIKGQLSGSIRHGWYGKLGIPSPFGFRGEVVVLDGVCLVTPKETLERVGIPDEDWADWAFYEHILSLRYREAGYRLKTVGIDMYHASTGNVNSPAFQKIRTRFIERYFNKIIEYRC